MKEMLLEEPFHGTYVPMCQYQGMYCFRFAPRDEWRLGDKHSPDEDWSYASIETAAGLAVGSRAWQCWVGSDGDGKWEDHTLTVTLQ